MSHQLHDAWKYYPHLFAKHLSGGAWVPYPYLRYISKAITQAIVKGNGRLLVSLPPRHGKSLLISHWIPLWYLNLFPTKKIILASYASELSHLFGRQLRNSANLYKQRLNFLLAEDSQASQRFNTSQGGSFISTGIGGSITGKGGDLLIIDDAIKNLQESRSKLQREKIKEWFQTVFYTRKEPNATIVVLMTRWHEDDLIGYLSKEHSEDWTNICLPALATEEDFLGRKVGDALCPERYTTKDLEIIRDGMHNEKTDEIGIGSRMFSALYQQTPVPDGGVIWKKDWFQYYTESPDDIYNKLSISVQSWDMTFTDKDSSDFVVGIVLGMHCGNIYILDMVRERMGLTKTLTEFKKLTEKWPKARYKLVEGAANGFAVENVLRSTIKGILLLPAKGSKELRAISCQPVIESGRVFLPSPEKAKWVREFLDEVVHFPAGQHDDQIDAVSQGINYLINKPQISVMTV